MPHGEILIVDDHPVNLDILMRILEEQQYDVRVTVSGALALAAVQAAPPDLILLDIMMPEMDGLEVCRRLKDDPATADIPIIFISALDASWDKLHAFEAGGVDYVTKPFKNIEVIARVESHLKLRQLQKDLQERNLELQRLADDNARLYEETHRWARTLEQQVQERTRDLQTALQSEQAMRQQLIQAGKLAAMGKMVASIAHELNNPLQIIRNALFLLESRVQADAGAEKYFRLSLAEIDRLSNLVGQLRQVYRPGPVQDSATLQLCSLMQELYALLETHLRHNQVRLSATPIPEAVQIQGDRDQLKQVFLNLCLNAIDAMKPKGGRLDVNVVVSSDARQVGIAFQDSGVGIDQEALSNIFDPFFTTKDSGTGLGLAISYDIIQKHGGSIEVHSQPGQGSTFTVWLPLVLGGASGVRP